MKTIIPFLLILIFIFVTCNEDKPTAPEEEVQNQDVLAEASIGPEGGLLETEDFKLNIPSGAFEQVINLKLSKDDSVSITFTSVTPGFIIEGIPENFNHPLGIKIRYDGNITGLNLIKRGRETEVSNGDSSYITRVYDLFEATINDGFLNATINPLNSNSGLKKMNSAGNETQNWKITGHSGCSHLESENFVLWSTDYNFEDNPTMFGKISETFEETFKKFGDLNFDVGYSYEYIHIYNIGNVFLGPSVQMEVDHNLAYACIKLSDNPEIDKFLYLIPLNFVESFLLYAYDIDPYYYLSDGISGWATYDYSNHISTTCLGLSFSRVSLTWHPSAMFEYLVDNYGEEILKKIVIDYVNWSDPMYSIQQHTAPVKDWLTDFYISLLTNPKWQERLTEKIQNRPNFWIDEAEAQTLIESTTNEVIWSENFWEPSGILFRVDLGNNLIDNSMLNFTIEGEDVELAILKFKNNKFELMDKSTTGISVSGIKELSENNYDLFAIITNRLVSNYDSYIGTDISLKIEQSSTPIIKGVALHLRNLEVNQLVHYESRDTVMNGYIDWHIWTHDETEVTFENNIFYQAYSYTENNDSTKYSGSMSIQFSDNMDKILTFAAEEKFEHVDFDPRWTRKSERSISGHDVPIIPYYDKYEVTGIETCDHLNNNLKFKQEGEWISNWEIISISKCVDQTRITIELELE
jgi:hypothetical protein